MCYDPAQSSMKEDCLTGLCYMRLLIVEDDMMIGESLQHALKTNGYAVDWVQDGQDALHALDTHQYDLMLLDLGLPKQSGLSVLEQVRKNKNNLPVLILTAKDTTQDRVKGLDTGADDYLVKPFSLEEVEARIRALLRRSLGKSQPIMEFGGISLNPVTKELVYDGKKEVLSAKEYAIMHNLLKHPGAVLSREQLEDQLYGWNEEILSNAVEVHIHQLRKKFGKNIIHNIRGIGYTVKKS